MEELDRFERKLQALRKWIVDNNPVGFDFDHGFELARPMPDSTVRELEELFGVKLPDQYRAFLLRFGDGTVGPAWYQTAKTGLTDSSKLPFPVTEPFLGCLSSEHQALTEEDQWTAFHEHVKLWDAIPHDNGALAIADYGCAIYGQLVLNGPYRGRVWILHGDTAYYGPFGGSEALHDQNDNEWVPTNSPRDYTFFEWYEHWLDSQLEIAHIHPD